MNSEKRKGHGRHERRARRARGAAILGAAAFAFAASGCGDGFNNEEMHLGNEDKARPFAVVVEPPEAAPGETVRVSLAWHDPHPGTTAVSWKVTLDFDAGLYGTEPIEGRVVPLETLAAVPAPIDEGNGFVSQTFDFVVPDSTLLWSSNLETRLDDEIVEVLVAALFEGEIPLEDVGQADVDALLRSLTPADLAMLPVEVSDAVLALADVFAAKIRFRATLTNDLIVDVTRSLTVRHSGRLGSPNTNANPTYSEFEVIGIPRADADWDAVAELGDQVERYPFLLPAGGAGGAGGELPPQVQVPTREGWTYYMSTVAAPQIYSSPFTRDGRYEERHDNRWYFYWSADPRNDFALYRNEDGEGTEMWALDEYARLEPPAADGPTRFRIVTVLRDERLEWERYQFVPGQTVFVGEVVFE